MAMDALVGELLARGVLDSAGADWALGYQAERGGSVDAALLALDLVDEEELFGALEACTGLPAVELADIPCADPEIGTRLPLGFTRSFRMCPLALADGRLKALVETPLSADSVQELREVFGLEVDQRIAPAHHVALARGNVYGAEVAAQVLQLESRLARRRGADVRLATEHLASVTTLGAAAGVVLEFAAALVEMCAFVVRIDDRLRVVASRPAEVAPRESVPLPPLDCSLSASFRHGGYFLGPLARTGGDRALYQSLGRPVPRWAFVAPFRITDDSLGLFYADNGPRGLARRRVAELTLLMARLGQRAGEWQTKLRWREWASDAETALASQTPKVQQPEPRAPTGALSAPEARALDRLRRAAEAVGKPVDELVEHLLRGVSAPAAAGLAEEVKGLFEKLATDIPVQLARGMESVFRDMMPRIGAGAAAGAAPEARPAASPAVDLVVRKESGPREVASYRSRRGAARRVKL